MIQNLGVTGVVGDENEGDEEKPLPKYLIDFEAEATARRSLPALIASRRCYLDQQADEDAPADADPQQFVDRIVEHCSAERDYLLPDTPLKEAIFRALLANGNEPMDAEEISAVLTEKWVMTPFPRNTAAEVISRLADSSASYFIDRVPEPEPEPEPGIVAVVEDAEPEADDAAEAAVDEDSDEAVSEEVTEAEDGEETEGAGAEEK